MNTKILCVDDEDAILKGFRLHLRKDFELYTANCGEEGLEVFEKESPFAVVLSDMRMPGMDGASMLAAIKTRCVRRGIGHVTIQLEPVDGRTVLDCECPAHGTG